jgi:hypothetical protein
MRVSLRVRAIPFLFLVPAPSPVSAQSVLDLGDFRSCTQCSVRATLELRLGEVAGPGIIESEGTSVVYDPLDKHYIAYVIGRPTVLLFDSAGAFVRSLVREGAGPGEVTRVASADYRNGRITMVDSRGDKWLVVDRFGTTISEQRLGIEYGCIRAFAGDTVVIGSADQRPASAGYPLHLVTVSDGRVVRHFGSTSGEWNVARPFAREVRISRGAANRIVWRADRGRLHFEEWTIDGGLNRVITGTPDWFPPVEIISRLGERPNTRLLRFLVDQEDLLWVLSRVADSRWQRVADRARTTPEGRILNQNEYFDTRLDVFDLENRRRLGTRVWDEADGSLVHKDGAVLFSIVEYDAAMNPYVALYRLTVER